MLVACMMVGGSPLQVQAKKTVSLSKTKISIEQGQCVTLRLNNTASKAKITWSSSDKEKVCIVSKSRKNIKIKGIKAGKATIAASYRFAGKKKVLTCKVTVQEMKTEPENISTPKENTKVGREEVNAENTPEPRLNATGASIYFCSPTFTDYIVREQDHVAQFQFKVENTNKKVTKWEMVGENAKYFTVTENGTVSGVSAPAYDLKGDLKVVEGTVKATLSDGTKLQARVYLADEVAYYLYHLFEELREERITDGMSELDIVKVIGRYIGECYDYDRNVHDWTMLILLGKGDCQASRYAIQYMCQYFGIKAGALRSYDIHGQTLVLADEKYYIVTTGYDMVRPRAFCVSEITDERAQELMEKGDVVRGYFE